MRTFGIEEELLLFDPETREVVPGAPQVLKAFREHGRGRAETSAASDELDEELFRHQLETKTDPTRSANDAFSQLVTARQTAGDAARAVGLAVGASGIVPLAGDQSVVTSNDRYRDMVDTYGEVARSGGTCGMHVHVAVDSDEEGVAVLDRIAPWLPVLLALSANSPFVDGRDSGYASWRAQVWGRWPSAGPTEQFGSVAGYREAVRMMIDSGAARDPGMLYFDARLSVDQPTIEVRVCDVCTDPTESVVIGCLVRALVELAAADWAAGRPPARWRSEELRVAHWRASRFGLAGTLIHPLERELRPAGEVVETLLEVLAPVLEQAGDLAGVLRTTQRGVSGNGATRQRAAYERSGDIRGVVDDLIARTEEPRESPFLIPNRRGKALGSVHG